MPNGKKNGKTPKKRHRYGSYVWTDKKTGYLYARVRVTTPTGQTKTVLRRAKNLTHVGQLADEIKKEHADRGQGYLDGTKMTFADLAEWYKEKFVVEAVYSKDTKVAGMRTWRTERAKIDRITAELGKALINAIDEDVLTDYRLKRLRKVGVATVNRDMETIRRMLRKAKGKRWLKTMVDFSELHDKGLERRRSLTVTEAQFERIATAARKQSPRIYALICTLYDAGPRPSEIYPVADYGAGYSDPDNKDTKYRPIRWHHLFKDGQIVPVTQVTSMKGDQIETRFMIVTERMADAYRSLWEHLKRSKTTRPANGAHLDNLVFPHKSYQSAWEIVRDKAKLPGLRLRDLRRDWVTRLAKKGYSDRLGQQAAGHKRMQQTFDYTVFDYEAALQAKAVMDGEVPVESDSVN